MFITSSPVKWTNSPDLANHNSMPAITAPAAMRSGGTGRCAARHGASDSVIVPKPDSTYKDPAGAHDAYSAPKEFRAFDNHSPNDGESPFTHESRTHSDGSHSDQARGRDPRPAYRSRAHRRRLHDHLHGPRGHLGRGSDHPQGIRILAGDH